MLECRAAKALQAFLKVGAVNFLMVSIRCDGLKKY